MNSLNIGHQLRPRDHDEVVALGGDVADSCALLVYLYPGAVQGFSDEMDAHERESEDRRMSRPEIPHWGPADISWRDATLLEYTGPRQGWSIALSVSYKAVFIFIRAYQDAIYRVLLSAMGEGHGGRSSMSKAMKQGSPVGALLDVQVPEYRDWYGRWASLRDQLKRGVGFHYRRRDDQLGIVFSAASGALLPEFTYDDSEVYLDDVGDALGMSGDVADLAVARLTEGWGHDELAAVVRSD